MGDFGSFSWPIGRARCREPSELTDDFFLELFRFVLTAIDFFLLEIEVLVTDLIGGALGTSKAPSPLRSAGALHKEPHLLSLQKSPHASAAPQPSSGPISS